MDKQRWQAKIREQLQQSGDFLRRLAPGMTYGALATATLLPVITAIQNGDLTALPALYNMVGGIGVNLVTNVIQEWKERSDEEIATQLPQALTASATDDEARAVFDRLIDELQTLRLVLESGALPDPVTFLEKLQAEVAHLGSHVDISVGGDWLTAGNISDSQNVAIGRGITQNNQTYNIGTQVINQAPVDPSQPDPAYLRIAYLNRLYTQADTLSLTGVDPKAASGEARLSLGAVYTALLTMTPEHHDRWQAGEQLDRAEKRLSAVEQLNRHQHLVLLGDPGSGKSTLVNFVALCLAGEALGKSANLKLLTEPLPTDEEAETAEGKKKRRKRQPWKRGSLLPVRVILRDFAARGLPAPSQTATADHLWHFLCSELGSGPLADYVPHLRNELQQQGGLLLLDGLDEVPDADQRRSQIKAAVEDFVALFPRCRVLVTSRTYAYQQQAWRLRGFTETVLAPFSDSQIRHFVERWYEHIAEVRALVRLDAQGRAEVLKHAIFASPRLHDLAERPLLLTLMASLHAWRGGTLPERREELYDAAVNLLLDWWESQRVVRDEAGQLLVVQPSLVEWLKVDREAVRRVLNELAYTAHSRQPQLVGTADILEKDLVYAIYALRQNPDVSVEKLIQYLSERAGLLVPRGVQVYTFPHRTFQEYLAACHLTDVDYPDQLADLARREPNRWREVTLLAGAKAVRGTASAIWSLVDALCYREPVDAAYTLEDVWGVHLAGQALLESATLDQLTPRNRKRVEQVRRGLLHALRCNEFPALERAAVGRTLAKLGDPRIEVLDPRHIEWREIPAGPFLMGSDEKSKKYDDETPQHLFDIPYAYRIARYPITNAQFQPFVEAGGYTHAPYWPEAAQHGYWSTAGIKGWLDKTPRTAPRAYGEPFHLPNHPVVGVTWYEALAFTRWLTDTLQGGGQLPTGWTVRLPTEAEWEKAARGTDGGKPYPWPGDQSDPNRANYDDTGIGGTTAVGAFPGGITPYGAEEMAGNVWEWCSTQWLGNYEEYGAKVDDTLAADTGRVVRGGSFVSIDSSVRCAARYYLNPNLEYSRVGVRVVLSPFTSGL